MPRELKYRIWFTYVLYVLFALVFPICIVNDTYGIFKIKTSTSIKLTGGLIIAAFVVYFFLKDLIRKLIDYLSPGPFRKILYATVKSLPLVVIALVAYFTKGEYFRFVRCIRWLCLTFIIANIVSAFEYDLRQEWKEIKLTKRQDKYREKYNL